MLSSHSPTHRKRSIRLLGALGLALMLTLASAAFQRVGPLRQVEGEGFCPDGGRCRIPVLGAGFPLAYLVDNPQLSVPHAVHLIEDDFRAGAFALDALFYLVLTAAATRLVRRRA